MAVTVVGTPGPAIGVTAGAATGGAEFPAAFVATTVNTYEVPLVSPVTVQLVAVPEALQPFPAPSVTM